MQSKMGCCGGALWGAHAHAPAEHPWPGMLVFIGLLW